MKVFEMFNEDTSEVIMLINYCIMKGEKNNKTTSSQKDEFWDYV